MAKVKTAKDKDTETTEDKSAGDSLPEPLYSLRVFNLILLAFSLLYDAFFVLGFVWSLLAYHNAAEMGLCGFVFLLNLLNTAAIACFLLSLHRRKRCLLQAYLVLNGVALGLEFTALASVYIFGDRVWRASLQNLLSTVFVLLYEVIFIGANVLVYLLVLTYCRSEWPNKTDSAAGSVPSDVEPLRDTLETSINHLDLSVDQFVESIRQLHQQLPSFKGTRPTASPSKDKDKVTSPSSSM